MMHGVAVLMNLDRLSVGMCAKHKQPNVRSLSTIGGRPCQSSKGVLPLSTRDGVMFLMKAAYINASPQNEVGRPD